MTPPPARTTIGQLVYGRTPDLEFGGLMEDLDAALSAHGAEERRLSWAGEETALIDMGPARVALALARDVDRAGTAVITVAVSHRPVEGRDMRLAERRGLLARLIAERLLGRWTPQETIWTTCEEVVSPALIDAYTAGLAARLGAARAVKAEQRARPARDPAPRPFLEPADLPRLMARLEMTLAARRAGQPVPDGPAAARACAEEARRGRSPLRLRFLAYLMDVTLMLVALPVGAAMLTYSLTRGANINTSGRVMAVSGVTLGMADHFVGLGGLQFLLTSAF
ncbi:hypothetical protein [Rubellimicrobium aerolatum]|uniref:RDD family protein n=1 Tax=Rubellimicrobium aerolatum TaxID=490979 RepID=A0ABW0SBI6_9RHOB|nr:hypothetical protein [Rubellimicrobium aerolatum]MBP1805532.1 hypothetical protein [Rubellimicrobium aerolatum]